MYACFHGKVCDIWLFLQKKYKLSMVLYQKNLEYSAL